MNSTQPDVSVVLTSYNHAEYIGKAIASVLSQTYQNFELLICDDASQDDSISVIQSFDDPRINLTIVKENTGGAIINDLLQKAKGKYIAIINSDDFWVSDQKLEKQVDILENDSDISACFTHVSLVDKKNKLYSEYMQSYSVFNKSYKSQAEMLRYFFDKENCLCTPSVMFQKTLFEELGGFNYNHYQLADFDLWVRFCKKAPIYIIEERLTAFRLTHRNQSNITFKSLRRLYNERLLIALSFFDGMSKELLEEGFKDLLVFKKIPSKIHFEIEKALMVLNKKSKEKNIHMLAGIILINQLMKDQESIKILFKDYGFSYKKIQILLSEYTVLSNNFRNNLSCMFSMISRFPFLNILKRAILFFRKR